MSAPSDVGYPAKLIEDCNFFLFMKILFKICQNFLKKYNMSCIVLHIKQSKIKIYHVLKWKVAISFFTMKGKLQGMMKNEIVLRPFHRNPEFL